MDQTTQTPEWFRRAIDEAPEHREVEVEGVPIHLRCWGSADATGLVFIHGGGAHSGWWDHVAPFFARSRRVVAVDLSGHGDSGHRPSYSTEQWAREAIAAAVAGGIVGAPYVIGHSMGGFVTATIGSDPAVPTLGQTIIDSPLDRATPEESRLRRPRKHYETRTDILARFTLAPRQQNDLPYVRDHVASQSIRLTDEGWSWKFDSDFFDKHADAGAFGLRSMLPRLTSPTALLRSEHGLVTPAMVEEIEASTDPAVAVIELPDAGHHPMMDQPLPLIAALRSIVAMGELTSV